MNNFWDLLYGVLFQPREALREIATAKSVGLAAAAFAIGVLLPAVAVALGMQAAGLPFVLPILFVQIAGSLVMWFVTAGILHLTAEMVGGRGAALSLFSCLGFVQFPRIFVVPFYVLAALLPPPTRPAVVVLAVLAVAGWVLTLHVLAVRATYDFGTVRALLVLVAPFAVMVMLVVTAVLLFVVSLAGLVRQGFMLPGGM